MKKAVYFARFLGILTILNFVVLLSIKCLFTAPVKRALPIPAAIEFAMDKEVIHFQFSLRDKIGENAVIYAEESDLVCCISSDGDIAPEIATQPWAEQDLRQALKFAQENVRRTAK